MEQLVDHIRTLESKDWCKVAKEQEGKIDELESENLKLKGLAEDRDLYLDQIHTLAADYNKLKCEYDTRGIQLADARKVIKESAHNELRVARERDHWKSEFKRIDETNDKLIADNNKLKDKLEKATNHIASLIDQIKGFEYSESVEIRDLKTMNADLMKINDELSLRLNASRRANDFLKADRDTFKAKNEKLSNELAHIEAELNKCRSNKEFNDTTYRTAIKCEIEERKKLEAENKDLKAKMETINNLSDLESGEVKILHPDEVNKLFP